ncbi:MAG: ATP-binding protein [Angelakisella sp.]
MRNILNRCRRYAADFSGDSGNLLFMGRTGLGKTYLSACIAMEVAARGYEVRYYPAQALIDRFERVRFNREAGADDLTAMREILSCDLLIPGRPGGGICHGVQPIGAVPGHQ